MLMSGMAFQTTSRLPASNSLRVTFGSDGPCAGQDPHRRAVRAGGGPAAHQLAALQLVPHYRAALAPGRAGRQNQPAVVRRQFALPGSSAAF